ncbi:MAG: hypothetical protein ACRD2W_09575 [Acidimicrobiales bacterium]
MASYKQSQAAQERAEVLFSREPSIAGIGITRVDGSFGLRINVEGEADLDLPDEIAGVPVVVRHVGRVEALRNAPRRR